MNIVSIERAVTDRDSYDCIRRTVDINVTHWKESDAQPVDPYAEAVRIRKNNPTHRPHLSIGCSRRLLSNTLLAEKIWFPTHGVSFGSRSVFGLFELLLEEFSYDLIGLSRFRQVRIVNETVVHSVPAK
jgi:hypothetical protein